MVRFILYPTKRHLPAAMGLTPRHGTKQMRQTIQAFGSHLPLSAPRPPGAALNLRMLGPVSAVTLSHTEEGQPAKDPEDRRTSVTPRRTALHTKPPLTSQGHPPLSFQTSEAASLSSAESWAPRRGSKQPGQAEGTPAHTCHRLTDISAKPVLPSTHVPDHT